MTSERIAEILNFAHALEEAKDRLYPSPSQQLDQEIEERLGTLYAMIEEALAALDRYVIGHAQDGHTFVADANPEGIRELRDDGTWRCYCGEVRIWAEIIKDVIAQRLTLKRPWTMGEWR